MFIAAIISEITIIASFFYFGEQVAYLWYNIIGCGLIMILGSWDFLIFSSKICSKSQNRP